MADITITLTVDVANLRATPDDPSKWAEISQVGGTQSGTGPTNWLTTVNKDDKITWKGVPKSNNDGDGNGVPPVINITNIDFGNAPVGTFGPQVHQTPDSGLTVTIQALRDIDEIKYTIDFNISFKARILDPKIKVIQPPH